MRSALLTSFCAAVCGAAAASATVTAQAVPTPSATPAPSAATVESSFGQGTALIAEASAAPAFSTSTGAVPDTATVDISLPDAPVAAAIAGEGQAGGGHAPNPQPIAPKYTGSILPGQGAVPFTAHDKVVYAFRDSVSPFSLLSRVASATYSQAVDSAPHYGQGWGPYGQRVGASFARGTVQTLATEAVFDPLFRDDPRYYILGRQHKFVNRVVYAATRVLVTRTDSGHNTLNAPLLLGYAAAAGANFAYYPHRDRNFGDAAVGYAGSLGGGVLGFEISEFLPDALRIVHLHHQ